MILRNYRKKEKELDRQINRFEGSRADEIEQNMQMTIKCKK